MAFRLAIIALENKSFEMPIVDLFTTMTSLASTAAADNCRFCFQSGNAWSVIARGGLQQSEKLIISYQIPLSLYPLPTFWVVMIVHSSVLKSCMRVRDVLRGSKSEHYTPFSA